MIFCKKIKRIVQKFLSVIALANFLLYEGYKVIIPVLMGKTIIYFSFINRETDKVFKALGIYLGK